MNTNHTDMVLSEVIKENAIVATSPPPHNNLDLNTSDVYIEVTQMVDLVLETQECQLQTDKVKEFLQNSWDNMAEGVSEDEIGIDYIPEREFQLVTSKKRRGKKPKATCNTEPRSSTKNLTL